MGSGRAGTVSAVGPSMSVTHAAAVDLAHHPRRDHELTDGGRVERQPADRERTGSRQTKRVVGLDRGECGRDLVGSESRRDT